MTDLEGALRGLEIATAALAEIPASDVEALAAALDSRLKAISRVAGLTTTALAAAERDDALQRLEAASRSGGIALQKLAASKDSATAEWSHWNRISLALIPGEAAEPKRIDCSA